MNILKKEQKEEIAENRSRKRFRNAIITVISVIVLLILLCILVFDCSCSKSERNLTSLTFINEYSETISMNQFFGENFDYPDVEEVNGKIFYGWYLDEDYTMKLGTNKVPLENKTFYARWEDEKYLVQFIDINGILFARETAIYGDKIDEPTPPQYTDYIFVRYSEEFPYEVESDVTIEATYEEIMQSIEESTDTFNYLITTLDSFGNQSTFTTKLSDTPEVEVVIPIEEKEGFTAVGYIIDDSNVVNEIGDETEIVISPKDDCTVEILYEPITYTLNLVSHDVELREYEYAFSSDIEEVPNLEKSGYIFLGWFTDRSLTEPFTYTTMPACDLYLYPGWEKLPEPEPVIRQRVVTSVNLNVSESSGTILLTSSFNEGDSVDLYNDLVAPTKESYSFEGYYSDSSLQNRISTLTLSNDTTIYVNWLAAYTVYYVDYDSTSLHSVSLVEGSSTAGVVAPTNPTRTGYTFNSWDTMLPNTMPANNITITATYNINSYTVKYVDHDGTVLQSGSYQYSSDLSSVTAPSNPTRTGYSFNGWDSSVPNTMPASDVVINATYNINSYSISYKDYDGTVLQSGSYQYSSDLSNVTSPSSPTRTGYSFSGWDSSLPSNMPASDLIINAQYSISSYVLEYVDHDGTVLQTASYQYDVDLSGVTPPSNPRRTGYTFAGWDSSVPATMPASTVTITATYNVQQYALTLNSDNGDATDDTSTNYAAGSTIQSGDITSPIKTDHAFTGWYDDSNLTNEVTFPYSMPASNVTFYAFFTPNLTVIESEVTTYFTTNSTFEICSTTEEGKIYEEVMNLYDNDPNITITAITDNGDGTYAVTIEQTEPNLAGTTTFNITVSFTACETYTQTLLTSVDNDISTLIPTGLFHDIPVPNLNADSKTTGITNRIQKIIDKFNVGVTFRYDDSVLNQDVDPADGIVDPNTDSSGMTGTAEGIVITVSKTYNGVTNQVDIPVAASFDQGKGTDDYVFPDDYVGF